MNILHVRPTLEVGGATEYVVRLVNGLAANQHHVVVASAGGTWSHRLSHAVRHYDTVGMMPRVGAKKSIPNAKDLAASAVKLSKIIREERIEVINTHHRFASLISKIAARLSGVPVISTMHEIRRDGRRITMLALGQRVVTLSSLVRNFVLTTYRITPERIAVIPMGIAIPPVLTTERRATLLSELGLNGNAPIIGCVARLTWRKGHIHLINAVPQVLQRHPDAQFILIGEGDERAKLEARIRELQIERNVLLLGARNDVPDLIGLTDFTVLPSLEEEFGIALIESMAQHKPVVASAIGGIPEIVRPNQTGLLAPAQDSDTLAAQIITMLDAPAQTRAMGEAGYRLVEERYSLPRFVEQTEQLYRSVLR